VVVVRGFNVPLISFWSHVSRAQFGARRGNATGTSGSTIQHIPRIGAEVF
jgi:hypothetical protein